MAVSAEFDPPVLDASPSSPGGDGLVLDVVGDLDQDTGPLLRAALAP
ncbi:hypothetical protein [Kitasatospora sp. NPDC050543]